VYEPPPPGKWSHVSPLRLRFKKKKKNIIKIFFEPGVAKKIENV